MSQKLTLSIIGFGGMAGYHLRKIRKCGLFNVIGAYDTDPARLKAAELRGLKAYKSLEELIADKPAATLIATPNDVHEEYAVALAKNKIHVICEKPVTLSPESFIRMNDAARENGVTLSVHQNRRWDKDFLTVKNIIEQGNMGEVYKITSNVTGSHGVPGAWRKDKARGGGMLYDWGVHLIDQLLTLRQSPVTRVYCRLSYVYGLEVDDGLELDLTFADGFRARIYLDTNSFIQLPRWEVYGLEGTAVIKNWSVKGKLVRVKHWFDKKNRGINAGNGFTKTMADRSRSTLIVSRLPKAKADPFVYYKGFYNEVVNGASPIVPAESVLRCLKVIDTAFKSAEINQTIEVNI